MWKIFYLIYNFFMKKNIKYDYPVIFYNHHKSEKSPIIFAHGVNSSHKRHDIFPKNYHNHDYYGIAFPGNNRVKAVKNHQLSVEQYADLLIDFTIKNNLKKPILIGHSMGGGTIALAFSKRPDLFSKLIFVAPMNKTSLVKEQDYYNTYFPKTFDQYLEFLKVLFYDTKPLIENKTFIEKERKEFDPDYYNNPDALKIGMSLPDMNLMNKIEDGLKKINIPTLLILGEKDGVIDRENCINYFKKLVKNIEINVVPKTGHVIFNEDFDSYLKIVSDFLNK